MSNHATPPRPPGTLMLLTRCVAWSAAAWITTALVSALVIVSLDGWRESGPFALWNFAVMFLITSAMTGGFTMPAFFAFGIPTFWLVRHRRGWSWKVGPGLLVSALSIGSFFMIMPIVETCQNSADARATIAATLSEHDLLSLRGVDAGSVGSRFCPDTFAYAREGRQMEGSVQANPMTGPTINERVAK